MRASRPTAASLKRESSLHLLAQVLRRHVPLDGVRRLPREEVEVALLALGGLVQLPPVRRDDADGPARRA